MFRSDAEISHALKKLREQVHRKEILEIGELLHVFGIWLWLSDIGVSRSTRAGIVRMGKRYVSVLLREKKLKILPENEWEERWTDSFAGLEFRERTTAEWRELFGTIEGARQIATDRWLAEQVSIVVSALRSDLEKFRYLIAGGPGNGESFSKRGVMKGWRPRDFVDELLKKQPSDWQEIFRWLEARWANGALERHLADEKDWVLEARRILLQRAKRMSTIRRYTIVKLIEWHLAADIGLPPP